ncbi:TIGR04002 family protein [Ruminococcus flavefaciens]|uniref:TIGR04002 family protein n=1 Tax=Ruminococcus flavefaciens TaxID=1265 RepID=A0A1M7LAL8_RUMFL|nr:TIGR04002 family protein [Ruminococcus flavefaciens]SHM75171.1 TIGR04002 family protein [Ruminococcus flavefaciens]
MTRTAQSDKIKKMVLTSLFSALIFVFTAYIHVPTGAGYTHAGDGLIYLAASILPTPYAVAAGIIGGALADGLSGFPVWIPATIVIKALTALFFTNKSDKIITKRNLLGIVPSLVLCIVGYRLYEGVVITKGFSAAAVIAAFGQTPASCVQVVASTVLYIVTGLALDRAGIKKSHLI